MGKPSARPGFQKLQDKWYRKLRDSGFEDIEEGPYLRRPGSHDAQASHHCPLIREATAEFFRLVAHRLNETRFENEIERKIMTLYAEGHPHNEIKRLLKIDGHRSRVASPIHRWLRAWGLE